ncbi:MFS transporter, partial [Agrococcus casei]|uniref:MFS transporter n=1 Tax=Agrococcus casei TaxID=343512 RepID=UPI003F8E14C9
MRRPAKSAWHRASLSRSRQIVTLVTLGLLTGLGPFTIDLYLPAFPQLREDFGVADGQVQLTLAATTLGFALGQLVVGPLSDRIGRRIPLLAANSVHVLASLGVAMAPDIEVLSLLRILQGLGAAGGAVVAMAMVRDLFSGDRLIVALSRLMLVQGAAPVVAPIVGSLLLSV